MEIRKVSIGADLKNAIHYIVGQKVMGDRYSILHIIDTPQGSIQVWVKHLETYEVQIWKEFNKNMPITIEANLEFYEGSKEFHS